MGFEPGSLCRMQNALVPPSWRSLPCLWKPSVQGTLQTFTNTGDSSRKLDRKFCPRCGSPVIVEAEGFPGMALIMGGTLDDTTSLTPTMALFCHAAQPWLAISHEMKSFPRMPKLTASGFPATVSASPVKFAGSCRARTFSWTLGVAQWIG